MAVEAVVVVLGLREEVGVLVLVFVLVLWGAASFLWVCQRILGLVGDLGFFGVEGAAIVGYFAEEMAFPCMNLEEQKSEKEGRNEFRHGLIERRSCVALWNCVV